MDHLTVLSILEVLQTDAACRGLAFLGCNFGDEALQAVVSLLQKGCGKWWTGPKIQLLDITAQHSPPIPGTHVPGQQTLRVIKTLNLLTNLAIVEATARYQLHKHKLDWPFLLDLIV